jgi:hypothetical protein
MLVGLSNENETIAGGIAGAKHIHTLAEAYGANNFTRTIVLKNYYLGLMDY